ncbi:DoxX family protein [Desulfuromonas sp. TF]|uniref:DoxX family protein n=1 Tax=Desulfuromonas sp. TF TaxID=1232410 RepID=UPI00041B4F2B|nr:DoxX family protein [Desulfuromonas sp. TF]
MKKNPFEIRRIVFSRRFYHLLRWGLGGLFLYAGALKLSDPLAFAIQIEKFGLLPPNWLDPVALLLPIIEILAGLVTLLGLRGGVETIGLLLLVFLAVLGYVWWSGMDVPCGCFSLEDVHHRYGILVAIVRDLFMLAGAAFLFWRQRISFP